MTTTKRTTAKGTKAPAKSTAAKAAPAKATPAKATTAQADFVSPRDGAAFTAAVEATGKSLNALCTEAGGPAAGMNPSQIRRIIQGEVARVETGRAKVIAHHLGAAFDRLFGPVNMNSDGTIAQAPNPLSRAGRKSTPTTKAAGTKAPAKAPRKSAAAKAVEAQETRAAAQQEAAKAVSPARSTKGRTVTRRVR
jgi:hypothetical protein